jgi:hypothetical protein
MGRAKRREPSIVGRVVESESGEPLAGHLVRVYAVGASDFDSPLGQARTDRHGAFAIQFRQVARVQDVARAFPEGGPDLDLRVYDRTRHPVGDLGPLVGDERFIEHLIAVSPRNVQWLNKALGDNLEKFFKDDKALRAISEIIGEEYGVAPDEIYQALVDSDPFGISPATFRTTICCVLNNLLDTFKQTRLASHMIFGGNEYKHIGVVTLNGFLRGPLFKPGEPGVPRTPFIGEGYEGRPELDEDFNFKVIPDSPNFLLPDLWRMAENRGISINETNVHRFTPCEYLGRVQCEIIPCDQTGALRGKMNTLRRAARDRLTQEMANTQALAAVPPQPVPFPNIRPILLRIIGMLTWDGSHSSGSKRYPGHIEIHPVYDFDFIII